MISQLLRSCGSFVFGIVCGPQGPFDSSFGVRAVNPGLLNQKNIYYLYNYVVLTYPGI